MTQRAYITFLGRSVWALINSYNAVLSERKFHPDSVFVFAEEPYKGNLDKVLEAIEFLSNAFGFGGTNCCVIFKGV